ncbi:MAG: VPLPA-CTERM sorting domain-containing protein [Pseudomonadota bacterium]
MNKWPTRLAAASLAVCLAAPAHAVVANLQFDTGAPDLADRFLDEGDQSSDNGVTMTFFDLVVSDGSSSSLLDSDGIFFSTNADFDDIVQLSFSFDTDVIWFDYDVDFSELAFPDEPFPFPGFPFDPTPAFLSLEPFFFQVAGSNGVSGPNELGPEGRFRFDMGSIPFFKAGETYTLTHNLGDLAVQIDEIDVVVTPLPASALMLLGGLGAFGLFRRFAA